MAFTKARERLIEDLKESLEKNELPWEKPWSVENANSFLIPKNGVTETNYKGMNELILFIASLENNYNDNRWMTFKQIQSKNYKLKEGSKGVPIEFFMFKDKSTGKEFDFEAFNKLDKEEQREKRKDLTKINKTYYVFNASCVDGIELLKIPEINLNESVKEVNDKVNNIISNMELNEFTQSGVKAFYSYHNDCVNIPPKELFKDETYLNGTILHELAHATAHESRLNREDIKSSKFGSDSYAIEELRAELSSIFMQNELGMKLEKQHVRNNTAYMKNWLSVLNNEPEKFMTAIQDAYIISDYLTARSADRNLDYVLGGTLDTNIKQPEENIVVENMKFASQGLTLFEIDKRVTEIGNNAYALNEFTVVDLRECISLNKVGYGAFSDSYISKLYLNDALETIDAKCFKDNDIKEIVFGTSVSFLGAEAFADNKNLKIIEFTGKTPPVITNDVFLHCRLEKIIVPQESVDLYKEALNNSQFLMIAKEHNIDELIVSKEDYELSKNIKNEHIIDEIELEESIGLSL